MKASAPHIMHGSAYLGYVELAQNVAVTTKHAINCFYFALLFQLFAVEELLGNVDQ